MSSWLLSVAARFFGFFPVSCSRFFRPPQRFSFASAHLVSVSSPPVLRLPSSLFSSSFLLLNFLVTLVVLDPGLIPHDPSKSSSMLLHFPSSSSCSSSFSSDLPGATFLSHRALVEDLGALQEAANNVAHIASIFSSSSSHSLAHTAPAQHGRADFMHEKCSPTHALPCAPVPLCLFVLYLVLLLFSFHGFFCPSSPFISDFIICPASLLIITVDLLLGWEQSHQNWMKLSLFIKNHFHQKPLSSKTTFIKIHFHPKPLSSENHFHQNPVSSKTNFKNLGP